MPKGISSKKFLSHHCFPLHDHFGEFLVGFAHSTQSWMVSVMWRPPKVKLVVSCNGLSMHFLIMWRQKVAILKIDSMQNDFKQCKKNQKKTRCWKKTTWKMLQPIVREWVSITSWNKEKKRNLHQKSTWAQWPIPTKASKELWRTP